MVPESRPRVWAVSAHVSHGWGAGSQGLLGFGAQVRELPLSRSKLPRRACPHESDCLARPRPP